MENCMRTAQNLSFKDNSFLKNKLQPLDFVSSHFNNRHGQDILSFLARLSLYLFTPTFKAHINFVISHSTVGRVIINSNKY